MATKEDICHKIESVIPEAGSCGVDFFVEFDEKNQAWVVDLHQDRYHLETFVDTSEADACLEQGHCISLGLQIGQLKNNLKLYRHC